MQPQRDNQENKSLHAKYGKGERWKNLEPDDIFEVTELSYFWTYCY